MEFEITEYIKDYVKVGEEYQLIEAEKRYVTKNWDDLQNLIMTLIDFSNKTVKFSVTKKEVKDEQ